MVVEVHGGAGRDEPLFVVGVLDLRRAVAIQAHQPPQHVLVAVGAAQVLDDDLAAQRPGHRPLQRARRDVAGAHLRPPA